MDESTLIRRLRSGDEEAFEIIFRNYFKWLCLSAEHYVKDKSVAEEIVEDFFCHLWDNCHDLLINSSLKGYLFRSIHNRCLNYLRSEKVKERYIVRKAQFVTDDELLSSRLPDILNADINFEELQKNINKAIRALPDQCREVFCMNRFYDYTYAEIAEKLGISINTVKTQMSRALQKLKESLKDYLLSIIILLISKFI